jgi:LPPG:FO 2-phospho-L-lactate transferase
MITVLAGGTGAAKFIRGLVEIVPQAEITIIGNTGDDVAVWGLHVSPDLDTIMYLIAGLLDEERGWGIKDDTFACLQAMQRYGEMSWFQLGDRDLATHIERTAGLSRGLTLTQVTEHLCRSLNVPVRLLPMSNEPVHTRIGTPLGTLSFQEFFVRNHWSSWVTEVEFHGSETARPAPGVVDAILASAGVIIAPSNPITSIGPILAVEGIRHALRETSAPVVAVSPIVGGQAVSGPAGKLMTACGHEVSALGVAQIYRDFLDVLIIDEQDARLKTDIEQQGVRVASAPTIMCDVAAKVHLARQVLAHCSLAEGP